MEHLISLMLVVVGIIHLLPVTGALSRERVQALYGLHVEDPSLEILLRHRAVLFGLLGAFLIVAAFEPAWQTPAFIAGWVSVVSFLQVVRSVGRCTPQIRRVVIADVLALGCLVIGSIARYGMPLVSGDMP